MEALRQRRDDSTMCLQIDGELAMNNMERLKDKGAIVDVTAT